MSSIWTLSDPNGTKFLICLSVPGGLIQILRQITGYLTGLMLISVKIIIIILKKQKQNTCRHFSDRMWVLSSVSCKLVAAISVTSTFQIQKPSAIKPDTRCTLGGAHCRLLSTLLVVFHRVLLFFDLTAACFGFPTEDVLGFDKFWLSGCVIYVAQARAKH